MVTFFRASPSPTRVTRAAKPPRRRQPKKTNDLPHPNKLPGIFGKKPRGKKWSRSTKRALLLLRSRDLLFVPCLARNPNFGPEMQRRGAESSGFLGLGLFAVQKVQWAGIFKGMVFCRVWDTQILAFLHHCSWF